jgi:hypothetical protein
VSTATPVVPVPSDLQGSRPPSALSRLCADLAAISAVVALYRSGPGAPALAYVTGRPAYPGGQIHPSPAGPFVLVLGDDEERAESAIRVLLAQPRDPCVGVSVVRVGGCYKIAWTGSADETWEECP